MLKFWIAAIVLCFSSLVIAEKLFARSLRSEWTSAKTISGMTSAQAMNITGAKAAYKNSVGFIGNKNNSIAFGISFVAFNDASVTNSIGVSYAGQPKDIGEFANASGALMSYMAATCLGITKQNSTDFARFFFETISQAQKTAKSVTVQRQFGVFNMYISNATVSASGISYSLVIRSAGTIGKAGWVEYCNPKQ